MNLRFLNTSGVLVLVSLLGLPAFAEYRADYPSGLRNATTEPKLCDPADLDKCFEDIRTANQPFTMSHGEQSEYSVLLIHGLSDSPYYMKDVAKELFNRGLNVTAITLSGHGTQPEDLHRVEARDWKEDVRIGLEKARAQGKKVLIGGMSTGGLLAVLQAQKDEKSVAGVLAFSPALELSQFGVSALCYASAFKDFAVGQKTHGVGVRYQEISANGVCQLTHLSDELEKNLKNGEISSKVPVFMALTADEDTVDVPAALRMVSAPGNPHQVALFVRKEELAQWKEKTPAHVNLTPIVVDRPVSHVGAAFHSGCFAGEHEQNPSFPELSPLIDRFLQEVRAQESR